MSALPPARVRRDGPPAAAVLPFEKSAAIADRLEAVRARTLLLIEGVSEDALNRVHDPLMSPIAWDLGHIATFEDLWLVQNAFGRRPLRADLGAVYDPFSAPRNERGGLPYLRVEDALRYMGTVRERTLDLLHAADVGGDAPPLLADGFVYEMVLRHEQQHTETILQTLQIMTSERHAPPAARPLPKGDANASEMALVPAGPFEMGAPPHGFAYDNERPRHACDVGAFLIDRLPVTNGDMLRFVDDGGYSRPELWSTEGWAWREREAVELPRYWTTTGGEYSVRSFGDVHPVDAALPVCHVSWYEADAYARWAGKRLPTEAEWEKAAAWVPGTGKSCAVPWGTGPWSERVANLDQLSFGCAPAAAYAGGDSPCGVRQALGNVWEWTASGFDGYPGFRAFPYQEYSEEFFGGPYRVLRGGSWATQPDAVSTTFRNWDHPDRRQIFAGFRCAADLERA
jgi:gamma-glutamyl hercynylcysteine S-oxide synthase